MTLNVLNVAYPFARVGPDAAGGAEQVLHLIDRALQKADHKSIVVAPEGSVAAGELLAIPLARGLITDSSRTSTYALYRKAITEAIRDYAVDVVHLHGVDFDNYLDDWGAPAIATLHLPPAWYDSSIFASRSFLTLCCVSRAQRDDAPVCALDMAVIENGVAVDELLMTAPKRDFALALGRICPEKGFHLALEAASRAEIELLLAGEVFPYEAHELYFRREILPRLDGLRRFIGPIGLDCKRALLSSARCLLVPSLVAETSSLVAMEAAACGTPVIAFPSGALGEIVEHGITGFLVNTAEEMAQAIRAASFIDPHTCRVRARERFSAQRMTNEYLMLYQEVAGSHRQSRASRALQRPAANVSGRVSFAVLTEYEEIEALLPDWLNLWRRCGATPFQSPHWILSWLRHFQRNGRLSIVALWRGPSLTGLIPLWVRGREDDGAGEVLLIGSGVSDWLDALFEPGAEGPCGASVVDYLVQSAGEWESCDWQELPAESPLLSVELPPQFDSTVAIQSICPTLKVGTDIESTIPRPTLKRLRYYRRRLEREAKVLIEAADQSSFDRLFGDLLGLHQARWNARGESGVLNDPSVAQFHREAARALMAEGALRLYSLRVEGNPAASFYGFQWRGRTFYYIGGFDPHFSGFNVGTVLVGHAIEDALREHSREFCFLRGNEAYKYSWGARDSINYRRLIRKTLHPETRGTSAYDSGA
jgi:CelD/BcsL family acetyltransferase involved in cellulose biosynthesis/glycosyltransferase involved in cell wall biosynthesis